MGYVMSISAKPADQAVAAPPFNLSMQTHRTYETRTEVETMERDDNYSTETADRRIEYGEGRRQSEGTSDKGSGAYGSAKERVTDQTSRMAESTGESARQQASRQKAGAAEQIQDVGRALHETSDNLRNQQQEKIASVIGDAAGQVDRLSGYLRERSVEDLLTDVRQFARRDPALFLGGAALLGLIGGRFFRSSDRSDGEYDYDPSIDRY